VAKGRPKSLEGAKSFQATAANPAPLQADIVDDALIGPQICRWPASIRSDAHELTWISEKPHCAL